MALYYSKGKIVAISDVKSGTSQSGFNWQNVDLTLEIPGFQGASTKQVFRASGDKVDEVLRFKVGDDVQVGFILYAREWNGRMFNNVDLVNITDEAGAKPAPHEEKPKEQPTKEEEEDNPDGDLPF